jgi:L-glutamine-phosphate cytidylyltransferase
VKAIILAAGRGSRMKNLTDERPKCLADLRGRPLLQWQLEALRGAGVDEIGIVTGYRHEMLSDRELVKFYNPRWAETNMVSSLACAGAWLEREPCVVSYSDIFYGAQAVRLLIDSSSNLAITFDPNWQWLWEKRFANPLTDAETFRINDLGNVIEIGQKPQELKSIQGQYMGLLRFTPFSWACVEVLRASMPAAERDRMDMTGMLQRLIVSNTVQIKACAYVGEWGEVDSSEDLHLFNNVI